MGVKLWSTFTCTGDNTVRLWDRRKPESSVVSIAAHEGEVLTCDWCKYNQVSICEKKKMYLLHFTCTESIFFSISVSSQHWDWEIEVGKEETQFSIYDAAGNDAEGLLQSQ